MKSKIYKKTHASAVAANNHAEKIKKRGGTVKRFMNGKNIVLEYTFPSAKESSTAKVKEVREFLEMYTKTPLKISLTKTNVVVQMRIANTAKWLKVSYPKHKGLFHNYHEILQELKSAARKKNLNKFAHFK